MNYSVKTKNANGTAEGFVLELMVWLWLKMRHMIRKVVDYVMTVKQEAKFDIPEVVFHSAHTIGKGNIDKNSKNYFKVS